jgi:hypothetical protein
MTRFWTRALTLLVLAAAPAARAEDAKTLAQNLLDKGAALFNTRDPAAMAATYVPDAELKLFLKDSESGQFKAEVSHGRAAIEQAYANLFKDVDRALQSRNVVEYAHFIGTDLLVIHGTFNPDLPNFDKKVPFVQVRTKQGDAWRILSLHLFVVPE